MTYDVVIVGAGISGLGLAHLSHKSGLRTLVLEADTRIGGCLYTHYFPSSNDFWVEAGAHTCYNSYGHLLDIIADLGIKANITPKIKLSFKLLNNNRLRSVISGIHPLELVGSLPRLYWETKVGRSVKEYYSRILGRNNYKDLFGPAFNAVLSQFADEFPADMLFRPKPRNKNFPRSFTFPAGLSTIANVLAKQPGLEVLTNSAALAIEQEVDGYRVLTTDGRDFVAKHIAIAIPPDQAAILLAGNFPELAGLLGEISMAEITSVSVAVASNALIFPPFAGVIAPYEAFYSIITRDYLKDAHLRAFTFHFPTHGLDATRQVGRIREILKVPKDLLTNIAYTPHRLPALRTNHVERVARIDRVLAGTGLLLTGNYFLGVSIEDCLTRSANEWHRLMRV